MTPLLLGIIARVQPGVDMFSMGLSLGALVTLATLVRVVPLIAAGMRPGLVQFQAWLMLLLR